MTQVRSSGENADDDMSDDVGYMNDDHGLEPDYEPGCEDGTGLDTDFENNHMKKEGGKRNKEISRDGIHHHYVNLHEIQESHSVERPRSRKKPPGLQNAGL